jgi:hypothetical protein
MNTRTRDEGKKREKLTLVREKMNNIPTDEKGSCKARDVGTADL